MSWLFLVAGALLLSVALTVFFGPPYLPTLETNKQAALDLLALRPGQTMLELGCGDGRVLIAAAKQGVIVVGIELSPLLALISWLRTRRYRKRVKIIWGNYFRMSWPQAEAIFTFMIDRQMAKLDQKIIAWHTKPVKLASVAFRIPNKKPAAELHGVFLYEYK